MIEIIKEPYPCAYSKNDIDFIVHTNMSFTSISVLPSITFTINDVPDLGEFYRIKFVNPETGKPEEFYLLASLTADQNHEIIHALGLQPIDPCLEIVKKLNLQTPGNSWYTIEYVSATEFKLTANYPLQELIPSVETNQSGSDLSWVIDQAHIDAESREGYQMSAQVYYEDVYGSTDFRLVSSMPLVVDNNDQAHLDVQSILDDEIEGSWTEQPVPEAGGDCFIAKNLKRYYIVFSEKWSGEVNSPVYKTDIKHVHWGGVATDDSFVIEPLSTDSTKFLTWWPSGKKLTTDQDDWLSWMNRLEAGFYQVWIKIVTNVGSTEIEIHQQQTAKWQTITFPAGYSQNDLEALVPGETISNWSFYIKIGTTVVSESFAYYKDFNGCMKNYIMYFNSFGMPETLSTSGNWSEIMNISGEISERSKSFNLNRLLPRQFVFFSTHQNSFKAETGLLSKLEAERLQSGLNSTISYVKEGKGWRPVIMTTKKAEILKENVFLRRLELEIIRANDNDRASFYPVSPSLELSYNCGIDGFTVETNGTTVDTYGDLSVYKKGILIETVAWDAGQSKYPLATKIIVPGNDYRVTGEIDGFKINKSFVYHRKRMEVFCTDIGAHFFSVISANLSEKLFVDWGEGNGFQEHTYNNTLTSINNTFTKTGKKRILIEKECFDDIIQFSVSNIELQGVDSTLFVNLKTLILNAASNGGVYLAPLQKLETIGILNQDVTSFNLGFQKNLQSINIQNTGITSAMLDNIILELWKYRQFYNYSVNAFFQDLGFTPSALFTAIKNGTGAYVMEGLVPDYGWTITTS